MNTISTFLFAVLACMEISKRNGFILWNFSSSRYICFMFVCFCVPISFCRYYFYVCVCVCSNLLYCQLHFVKLLMQIFQLLQARPCHAKIPFSSPPAAAAGDAAAFWGKNYSQSPDMKWQTPCRRWYHEQLQLHGAWLGQRPFITLPQATEPEAVAEVC